MKKMLSRLTAATLAAGMLVTEASASIVVPDSTDRGTIAGSGMWLVQVYNMADDEKENVDYGIDLSAVAGARFTFEVDLDNPDLNGDGLALFEGFIGGGITLSCNGGDIYPYKDMPDVEYDSSLSYETSEVHSTYNWASQNWWGCEFVNAAGETVDTNPNTCDDDPTNDMPLTTVNLGDYTYSITADFVNPLTCETDDWDINEIDVMQVCLQEWGADIVPIEITCCEILDADGNVLLWFDGQGNPSLENTAAGDTDSGSSGSDDDSSVINTSISLYSGLYSEYIVIGGSNTNKLYNLEENLTCIDRAGDYTISFGNMLEHLESFESIIDVGFLVYGQITTDTAYEYISTLDFTLNDFKVTLSDGTEITFFDSYSFSQTHKSYYDGDYMNIYVSLSDFIKSNRVLDDEEYLDFIARIDSMSATFSLDSVNTVYDSENSDIPDDDDDTDDTREVLYSSGTLTTTLDENGFVDGTALQLQSIYAGGVLEFQPGDRVDVTVAPVDDTVDTSEWVVAYNCFTSEWGGWCAVQSNVGELELSATIQDMMDVIDVTDIADFGGFLFQVWNTEADIEIDWTITITPDNSTSGDTDDDDSSDSLVDYNAYMVMQTGAYSFRNKWNDTTYGKDSEYFDDIVVWGEADAFPEYSDYYDSELDGIGGYVIPATITDAKITGNGTYKVSISDFDWALDGATDFNVLSISTDIPINSDITFSDVCVYVDGEKDVEMTGIIDSTDDYVTLLLVNTWETSIGDYTGTYPTESFEIEFTIDGIPEDGIVETDPYEGWVKFYMQNNGGDWQWFEDVDCTKEFKESGIYEVSWTDVQNTISKTVGDITISYLKAPVESWEDYPTFGVQIGSHLIDKVGEKGKVDAVIGDITITLIDGTSFSIPDRLLAGELLGKQEDWGISGNTVYIEFDEIIKTTLEIDDEAYFELLKSVDSISATVTVNEFVPISTDEAPYDNFYTADTVEITDIKVADNEITFSWTESVNADSYNIYLVDGNTRTFVAKTTELTYSYVGEYCSEYTLAVCGCAGEREGSLATFTVNTSHNYEDEYTTDREPTCSEVGAMSIHCKNCDARTNITEIETTDHDYSSVVVAPTYERDGYTLHMCLYCDDSYKTDITEMLALSAMTGVGVLSREANAITFKWDEYLGLDVDGTMLGYVIEEIADGEVRAGEDIPDITVTQWKYTGLKSSTEYTIQIRAYGIDSAGKTIYSKAVLLENVATLPASMTGFAVTGRGSDYLTLSWNKNTTADGYVVQIQENNSWTNIAVIKSADTLSYKVTGLEPNSFYRFRMVAYKSYGTSKLYSKYTGAIPGYTAPAMVTGLNVSASTDTTMTVSWDENAYADGFILDIYKDGKWQQAADVTSAETSVTIEGLTASTLYKFRIKSYASNGSLVINSTYSAAVSATTKPAAMSGVTVSGNTSTTLTVSWNKNASATGYILQMYTDGVWNNIANIKDINTTSYVVTGLSASTLYKFRMVAYNNSTGSTLYGKYTGAISGTTAPAAVTNLRMTNRGTDFISVAWDKNANATGYMVYIYDGTSWKLVKTLTTASSVSHKITGLESGKTYKVNVKAYKTSGTQKLIADASMVTATTL